jgi:C-terminal processing protease CtpA/Prc
MAQAPPPAVTVSAADQKAAIATLNEKLKVRYVFPEVATRVIAALQAKVAKGDFNAPTTAAAFSESLSKDLRDLAQDGHFRVRFDPMFKEDQDDEDKPLTKEEIVQNRLEAARMGYGLERVDRLPGNVGYLEVRGFGPTEFVGPAYSQAMALLAGSDAIIVDLRRNNGGRPESVAYLMSHFFAEGDQRHLNDIYDRPTNATRQYWTNPSAGPRYTGPVYVLTSRRTFSGGEDCAYDFQTQKRGTLVGEVTGGGANPGSLVSMGHGFVVFIPTGRAINPITKTNWEHVGVKPDVAVPATDALRTAHAAALKTIVQNEKDPEDRQQLEALLARVEKGEPEKPNYAPRR